MGGDGGGFRGAGATVLLPFQRGVECEEVPEGGRGEAGKVAVPAGDGAVLAGEREAAEVRGEGFSHKEHKEEQRRKKMITQRRGGGKEKKEWKEAKK